MRDDPAAAALLDAARRALLAEVAPALAGRPRYVALMVANALGVASREIAASDDAAAAAAALPGGGAAALVVAIRAGARDADPALHAALAAQNAVAAEVWRPEGGPRVPSARSGPEGTHADDRC